MLPVLAVLLLAQSADPVDSASSLARVRAGIERQPAIAATLQPRGTLSFRVTVEASKPLPPPWVSPSVVPGYVKPKMPGYHYEFLRQVTPEQFRAGTLYPVGGSMLPFLQWFARGVRENARRDRERRAREEVRQAMEQWRAAHRASAQRNKGSER